jgi:hypothetical protein
MGLVKIKDYGTLKIVVEAYTHRNDQTDNIPQFIQSAESRINSDLDDEAMESRASYTIPAGERFVTLPSDMRKLMNVQIAVSGGVKPLLPLSLLQMDALHSNLIAGVPDHYAITGDQMEVRDIVGEDTDMEIYYQYRLEGFSDDEDTNGILTKYPNIYLYASLIEYLIFVQGEERMPVFTEAYAAEVFRINDEAEDRKMSGGPIQIINLGVSTP